MAWLRTTHEPLVGTHSLIWQTGTPFCEQEVSAAWLGTQAPPEQAATVTHLLAAWAVVEQSVPSSAPAQTLLSGFSVKVCAVLRPEELHVAVTVTMTEAVASSNPAGAV